jgi:tRNA-specific 2-thiouridylase
VVGKDIENNRLLVGQGLNNPYLFSNRVIVEDINWISKERFVGILECSAKFRYRQEDQVCLIRWIDKGLIEVVTNKPVRAVTPGQACVFYNGEICLGGGTIKEVYQNQKKLMY